MNFQPFNGGFWQSEGYYIPCNCFSKFILLSCLQIGAYFRVLHTKWERNSQSELSTSKRTSHPTSWSWPWLCQFWCKEGIYIFLYLFLWQFCKWETKKERGLVGYRKKFLRICIGKKMNGSDLNYWIWTIHLPLTFSGKLFLDSFFWKKN